MEGLLMDKQLIQRLTLAARFPQPPAQEHMTTFATLVAEECAKIIQVRGNCWDDAKARAAAEEVADAIRARFGAKQSFGLAALAEEIAADDGSLPAGFKGSNPGDFTFRSPRGRSAEELAAVGKPGADLIHPDDERYLRERTSTIEECAQALEAGDTFQWHRTDGSPPVTYIRYPDTRAASFLRRHFGLKG
jgi:hypothetical protein